MALRLMTAFDKSGLLAVAKFIHLVAGLLLLSNRAVPFALATICRSTVRLFISLFIEGSPVSPCSRADGRLNALLMLAYLPATAACSRAGSGRRRRPGGGQNYESLFVNPLGNAPPRPISAPRWCWRGEWRSTGSWCRA
jgi:hypothetical protein